MEVLPRFIARLRHWHLFILMFVPMLVAGLFFRPVIEMSADQSTLTGQFTEMMLISWPSYVGLFGWVWSVGLVGNSALRENLRKSDRLAWSSSPVALAYVTIANWVFPTVMFDPEPGAAQSVMNITIWIASFLIIYAFFFAARAAASLGLDSKPTGGRIFLFFLGIMYYPIGVWFIQPRLNSAEPISTLGSQ